MGMCATGAQRGVRADLRASRRWLQECIVSLLQHLCCHRLTGLTLSQSRDANYVLSILFSCRMQRKSLRRPAVLVITPHLNARSSVHLHQPCPNYSTKGRRGSSTPDLTGTKTCSHTAVCGIVWTRLIYTDCSDKSSMSLVRLDCSATTLTSLSINLLVIFWITFFELLVLSKNTECMTILNRQKLQILSLKNLEAANFGTFLPDKCLLDKKNHF